jgi:transposase
VSCLNRHTPSTVLKESLRRWIAQHEVDAGKRSGLTTDERHELAELRRKLRRVNATS